MPKIITFGEIMLRLSPHGYQRLFQNDQMEATFGGGEANVAVSLCNYGDEAVFVTKLPSNVSDPLVWMYPTLCAVVIGLVFTIWRKVPHSEDLSAYMIGPIHLFKRQSAKSLIGTPLWTEQIGSILLELRLHLETICWMRA